MQGFFFVFFFLIHILSLALLKYSHKMNGFWLGVSQKNVLPLLDAVFHKNIELHFLGLLLAMEIPAQCELKGRC